MHTTTLNVAGMTCGHCVAAVRRALSDVAGIETRDVRIGAAELAVAPDAAPGALDRAAEAIREAGYDVTPAGAEPLTGLGRAPGR